jgi:hypothetical protein
LAFHSEREADHLPPSSAEVKEWVELYIHSPNTPSWRGAQGEHRDDFTFTFTFWVMTPDSEGTAVKAKAEGKGKGKVVPVLN